MSYDDTDREIAKLVPGELAVAQQQSEILEDRNSATIDQLLAGWPMRGNSWQVDASVWASRVLADQEPPGLPPLPPAVARALRQVMPKPSFGNLSALRKAALRRRPEWSRDYNARLDECVERVDVYLWHLGDEPAAGRCVLRALDRISSTARASIRDGLLRTAIETASGMSYEAVQRHIRASGMFVQMRDRAGTTQSSMSTWIEAWAAHQERLKSGEPEKVFVEDDDEITLVEAVADDRDRGVWAYAKPQPQTLVVVPSLDHLPKATLTQRDRRDTPRAEFAAIENAALPLKPAGCDIVHLSVEFGAAFPWMIDALDQIFEDLVSTVSHIALQPTILVGPPGCGKTTAALALCEGLGVPTTAYSAAGVSDGAFSGTSRQWSTGRASVPLQAVLRSQIANPVVVIDEIEKAGWSRHNGNLHDVLLSLTEPTSARCMQDPYLECAVDLSAVSYIGTANDADLLTGPLRDRFRILHVPAPGIEHLPSIVSGIVRQIRQRRGVDATFLPDLAPDELDLLARHWKPGSMRGLRRAVERLMTNRDRLATRN